MATITDNAAAGRYELIEADETAYADYRLENGRLIIDYVFSPPALRGAGTAGRLMEGVVADARRRGLKITPLCGYAAAWLRRHGDAADLLA
ncbi:MAG: GNAT family N-acetyltransferase [Caulobacter sp.]|nr:GNAT family N-acetyltransferase [Caulobacter sp.]